ncbi:type I-E CRISPR-associated endoribonuclease Cas2 [Arcanobacterium haemolyticum]|nr:type I-E CRISPR-associated endoribonuclease Cas2 [Arcanobacterium haemolyticum]
MVVLILTGAPASLRGAMTRWLLEVSAGVFVGTVSARVREKIWQIVEENLGTGRALLIWHARNEQRFSILSLGHEREPLDIEGLTVMVTKYRNSGDSQALHGTQRPPKESWSIAARRARYRNSVERALRPKKDDTSARSSD